MVSPALKMGEKLQEFGQLLRRLSSDLFRERQTIYMI